MKTNFVNSRWSTAALAAVAVLLTSFAATNTASAQLSGAVFTTDKSCNGVDLNIYSDKNDVYVTGGPDNTGPPNLPNGCYCVRVTDPSGSVVLGTSDPSMPFCVSGGVSGCYQLSDILHLPNSTTKGYADTPNPGGEYKVWVCSDCTFTESSCKTDNFKVRPSGPPPPPPPSCTPTICVTKFYDRNANGVQDTGEPLIPGWQFTITEVGDIAPLVCALTGTSPSCHVFEFGDFVVTEANPQQSNWIHTTPTSVNVTLSTTNCEQAVTFGNVCIGSCGRARTKGFWANKGQSLITSNDLSYLCTLCLSDASGSNFCPSSAAALSDFLLGANAKNMANQLSAQLAAMVLNVRHGFVNGNTLVYAPCLTNFGANSAFITINDLIAKAKDALCADGYTPAGDPHRAYQECLKNTLDTANNNNNCVQSSPCQASFSPCE